MAGETKQTIARRSVAAGGASAALKLIVGGLTGSLKQFGPMDDVPVELSEGLKQRVERIDGVVKGLTRR
jgi:hypothetical protein